MHCLTRSKILMLSLVIGLFSTVPLHAADDNEAKSLDELVIDAPKAELAATLTERMPALTSKAKITADEIENFNAINIEDTIKYLPNLFVRKRFTGDPNAVFSIRGNSNFQTARQMVFVDGFAIHNPLQSRWNGSPRWNLVSPEEVESTEVIYGPFSSGYSGNAMGGVVNIKTKQPKNGEVLVKQSYFIEDYELKGTDDTFEGFNSHASYGDKVGKFSYFFVYDHLENDGHPQSLYSDNSLVAAGAETVVTGAFQNQDFQGTDQIIFSDSGTEEIVTDLVKLKGTYEFSSNLSLRGMVGYVNRGLETDSPNNYLRDAAGNKIWGDGNNSTNDAQFNGSAFNVRTNRFSVGFRDKQEILVGAGAEGKLGGGWEFDAAATFFTLIEDFSRTSDENPDDPNFDKSGTITEYDDTGWETFDVKLANESFLGNSNLSMYTGYHFSHARLETLQYSSNDFESGTKTAFSNASGGDTLIQALFLQGAWEFMPKWKVTAGGRQEWWNSYNGFNDDGTGEVATIDRNESEFSPKFSLEHQLAPLWNLQFSLAKAYRFAIAEELFQNVDKQNSSSLADADLKTEEGFHKAFIIRRDIDRGNIQLTFFEDDVDNAIFNQVDVATNASTVLNIDEVRTRGIELAFNQRGFLTSKLDMRFNVSYIDSKILRNDRSPGSVGNRFPRVPQWRSNMFATYHISNAWKGSAGLRYSGSSFNTLPNDDLKKGFGSQSDFIVLDLKSSYRWENGITASVAIDNVSDELYFVHHPMPRRTFIMDAKWEF